MSIAIILLADAIKQFIVVAVIGLGAVAAAIAECCQPWPRAGLALVDISERCGRLARRMLRE